MRRMVGIVLIVIAAGAAAWFLGPRVARDTTVSFDPAAIGQDVEAWLAETEARVPNLRPDAQKQIVWAFPASRARTPLAIVYVHGFSASKNEIRPVPNRVAATLGANLFFTRLTGHGRDGPAMAEASVKAWVNDYAEALAVGRRLGERVIVVAVSTGASIAAWAATRPELAKDVSGYVLISPNFGVQAGGAGLLAGPWGLRIAKLVAGDERGFEPHNEAHGRFWTTRYPTEALLPMAATVELAAAAPVEKATAPALFILSDHDKVVRPDITRQIAERWGALHELRTVEHSDDPSHHVIAGDALSPGNNDRFVDWIVEWVRAHTE
ncbi:alpha/beta hydrolase [Nitratireductor sp. CAU 1489]|uniref:Alpha/beta hydrolase n=1 Tax=Nitratireductor arenosus TaxID=2682096 RepID=A0A844QHA6_9HYPH|nr:alpha/beta fold hydrolase [Nitratireductor arenosus]MVA97438.1 alpha/beta hydrolase [Nitratireductor arenosus]